MFSFQGLCCGDPRPCGEGHVDVDQEKRCPRERASHALSSEPSLTVSLKLKACERQEHNTWIYISTCYDAGLMRINACGNVPIKWQTSPLFEKLGQIGRLRSLLVPLQTVNKRRWRLSGSQGRRGRDESCFSVSVSTTWLTWRFWRGKRRQSPSESIACRRAGRLHLSLVFAARRLPSLRSPSYLTLALALRLSFYFGLTCARQSNTFAVSTLILH